MTETNENPAIQPARMVPADWRVKQYATEKPTVVISKEQVITRQGREFVLYAGLLDAAHRAGLTSIYTTLVQAPNSMNGGITIVHATAEFPWGSFTGIGDADDSNVGRMILPHKIRMAETRAKARALRDALNVSMAAVEELTSLPSDGEEATSPAPASGGGSGAAPRRVEPPDRSQRPAPPMSTPTTPTRQAAVASTTPADTAAALDKFNRIKTTALRLRDAHKLVLEDALLAPFTEDATVESIEAASQRLLARVNTAVQRNGGGK